LENLWDREIKIDNKIKDILELALKKKYLNIRTVKTRIFYNPSFAFVTLGNKLSKFQNMWEPNQDSFAFFACVHDHLNRNISQCNSYCHKLGSPNCGPLVYFLSSNRWPED
jgi:hypothetical protein